MSVSNHAVGTPALHAMAGLQPEVAERNRHRAVIVNHLRHAAKPLAEHGLTLVIEPINRRGMDELGYGGWVGCEYRPRGKPKTGWCG